MSALTCPHCRKSIDTGSAWSPPPKACPACLRPLALFDFRLLEQSNPIPAAKVNAATAVDLNRAGMRAVSRGAFVEAVGLFGEALKIKPNFPAALNNRGYALAACKNFVGAIADFDEALRQDVRFAGAYN